MAKIKDEEKVLKAAREKKLVTYKGTPLRLYADFSAETLRTKREWCDIFKVMKGKKKLTTKNILSDKATTQIWREAQEFSQQPETK